jgi:hypothetical protein
MLELAYRIDGHRLIVDWSFTLRPVAAEPLWLLAILERPGGVMI